jgi:hypothetical protein
MALNKVQKNMVINLLSRIPPATLGYALGNLDTKTQKKIMKSWAWGLRHSPEIQEALVKQFKAKPS